jgi:hypothetical protein
VEEVEEWEEGWGGIKLKVKRLAWAGHLMRMNSDRTRKKIILNTKPDILKEFEDGNSDGKIRTESLNTAVSASSFKVLKFSKQHPPALVEVTPACISWPSNVRLY